MNASRSCLLAFVEGLCGLQRAPRGEAVAPVRVALERGQVVQEWRALGLFLALDLLDRPVLAGDLGDDRVRTREVAEDARLVALEPESLIRRLERPVDEAVRLGDERLDLALAPDDQPECRSLHTAE